MRRNNMKRIQEDPVMLEEYDFNQGIPGKYAKRYSEGTNIVVIDPDVAEFFPDNDSVNKALRSLTEIIKEQKRISNKSLKLTSKPRK